MKPGNSQSAPNATVASAIRGRIRLKLGRHHRGRPLLDHIEQHLEAQPGIGDVTVDPRTGSVTIPYDHALQDRTSIFQLLKDLDIVVGSTLHPPSVDGSASADASSPTGLLAAIEDLNAQVRRFVGVPLDLKLVLPVTLLAAGIWSIGRRGLMIDSVPGWVFLWLAFDAFVKLHPESWSMSGPVPPSRGEAPATVPSS